MKYLVIISSLFILGCKERINHFSKPIEEYSLYVNDIDLITQEVDPNKFSDWATFRDSVGAIFCNDSIYPCIKIECDSVIKQINFVNFCPTFDLHDDRTSSFIYVKDDSVFHRSSTGKGFYSLDSLDTAIKAEQSYRRNGYEFACAIAYEHKDFKNLNNTLDKITDSYKKITDTTDLLIYLRLPFDPPSPPPPPPPPF